MTCQVYLLKVYIWHQHTGILLLMNQPMCNSLDWVTSQTSIVNQLRLSFIAILTILSNWSRHSHFPWLTSVEMAKTLSDKHKCFFPGFVKPISAWSGSTCFSYSRNSRESIGSTRNERIVMMERGVEKNH